MKKFGFVFPGQGSQKPGMLSELAADSGIIEATFTEASEALQQDLWAICLQDNASVLDRTEITQPVLLAASVAIWRLWREKSPLRPSILAGHSLGEYSALVCAGAMDFQDAVKIVHRRGLFMQSAVPAGEGKMAAIVGLDSNRVHAICAEAGKEGMVSPANFNTPEQTVIAGKAAAVDRAVDLCKEAGARRALPLKVSVPSHCELMQPAARELERELAATALRAPAIDVVQNVNAEICRDPEQIKRNLVRQLHAPVLWVDCIRRIYDSGAVRLVECGPGKVLGGLIRRIESQAQCFSSDDPASLDSAIAGLVA